MNLLLFSKRGRFLRPRLSALRNSIQHSPIIQNRSYRLNLPQKSPLLANRLEHQRYFGAAKNVSFRRRHQYAATKPVLDDHVDIIHLNMTREEVRDFVCGLTPEQKLDPAKHHHRSSSNFLRSQRSVVSDHFKAHGYRNIIRFCTVQSWIGCSTYPT